ncbi:TetR/AcrR family transcriptional regulator [Acidimicrobiia bacterium EGI L10123]|uniref:TetR/AcrR family transcriptional regulator n=1 Tax=Salinilacustrithrix flava TaxID=2957203 RepID=UPI003D7C358B|nr:TetR/AcrR family transcriptional regulator [Acidimicrobiia bacterium EGI L10123]
MARPRSEEARLRTIEATIEALLELGAEGLTMEEIAERSGVAKSTIYRHFGTREHLVTESVRSCVVEQPTPDSGSLADDLTDLFTRYDESEETKRLNELIPLLIDGARRDAGMREVLDALLVERQRPMRTVLKLAQARGEIDPDLDLDVAVAVLIGPFTYRRMVQDAEITDEFVAAVVQTGIAALRSTAPGTD